MASERLIDTARANYALVEELYDKYKQDPKSVSEDWIEVFKTLELIPVQENVILPASKATIKENAECQIRALINAYRKFGYLGASLNPLLSKPVEEPQALKIENFGFNLNDLSQEFPTCGLMSVSFASLAEIISVLKKTYSGRIGFEFKDRGNLKLEKWLEERVESNSLKIDLRMEQKQMIFQQLNKSELFESFIHTRFPGQKRFSLEGAETLIPMLSEIIEKGSIFGADEFVLGMTHRGRLNVLANILNKSYTDVFSEFEEGYFPDSFEGSGDVKYHKGFLSDAISVRGHQIKISLTPNPSHLESVDPVIEGQVKARQIKRADVNQEKVVPILTHGDAALSGQGVVYETLQLSKLEGYSTGGTIHIAINNQIGFTTIPEDGRSTRACTDIASTFSCPVLHVNAEDPEACVYAAEIAMELRHLFHVDVFIELICYRKYGHNESDEPAFTQPHEYKIIRAKKSIRELFRDHLIAEGVVEKFMAEAVENEFKKALQNAIRANISLDSTSDRDVSYKRPANFFEPVQTKVKKDIIQKCAEQFCMIPKDIKAHPKLEQLYNERLKMVMDPEKKIDWGMGEILAFATLLWEGVPVRLSGQDSGRGTFSHRHALLVDQLVEKNYFPLSHLRSGQGRSDTINSPLSEFAVLGFEYGYSIACPEGLVMWEAQFGDFGNSAQVIIDQYIAASEVKWGQKSSLVLLLPHGYEGQGPEHSSARIERYLSLSANDNMYVCVPSTPAQYFHLLRRQVLSSLRKPLICMTPKSLLRNPLCVSDLSDFERGSFEEVLDDPKAPQDVKRLVFCTGKLFYELMQFREKEKVEGVAFIRIEQLYPLHKEKILTILKKYKNAQTFVWAQEEPANAGAWMSIRYDLESLLSKNSVLEYAGRIESAAPATGSYVLHKKELSSLLKAVMTPKKPSSIEVTHFHRA